MRNVYTQQAEIVPRIDEQAGVNSVTGTLSVLHLKDSLTT